MVVATLKEKKTLLAESYLFRNISEQHIENLAKYTKLKTFRNREVICRRGELGTQMFLIAAGRVTLHTDSDEGKELGLGFLNQGDVFGEIALLDGGTRTATVKAIEITHLLVIEKRDFLPFLENNPKVAIQLLSTMAKRLRTTDEHFEDIFFRNLPRRLAKRFLALVDDYGHETASGIEISLKLSQGEIGKLTGASRESVNKQMRAWEVDGLIGCDKGVITIKQLDKLEDISALS